MPYYKIYAGLNGGFGGACYIETIEASDEDDANLVAYFEACEIYESYIGTQGLFNYEETLDENPDLTEEELAEMENEDRENWMDYYVEETDSLEDTEED